MIPLGKLLTLLIKTFSKPMLSYATKKQKKGNMRAFNAIFIWLGRKYYLAENFVNHNIRKIGRTHHHREISEQAALEKGIQTFHELILYSIVLGLPLYEMNKSSQDSKKKQEKLQNRLKALETRSEQIKEMTTKLTTKKYFLLDT